VYICKASKSHLVCYHVTAKLWAHKCWCLCVQNIRLLTYTVLQNQLVRLDYKPYVLMAATVVSILYMVDECGLLHYSIIILQKSHGHSGFFAKVTGSFWMVTVCKSQIVTYSPSARKFDCDPLLTEVYLLYKKMASFTSCVCWE